MRRAKTKSAYDQLIACGVPDEMARNVQDQKDELKALADGLACGGAAICIWCKMSLALVGDGLPYCRGCPYCRCCGDKIPHARAKISAQCHPCDVRDAWADSREQEYLMRTCGPSVSSDGIEPPQGRSFAHMEDE